MVTGADLKPYVSTCAVFNDEGWLTPPPPATGLEDHPSSAGFDFLFDMKSETKFAQHLSIVLFLVKKKWNVLYSACAKTLGFPGTRQLQFG